MKTTILKLLVAGVAIIGVFSGRAESSSATGPVSLHVGISPYFDPGSAGLVLTNLEMLLAKLPEGVEFSLEDGSDGSIIASGTVPHFEYPGIAAQVRALAVQRVALRRWLTAVHAGGVPGSGALNPPIYMRSLADHPGSGRLVVALVGSVMYANLGEPSFDFAPDRLPKFAHLVLSENLTPFGCADRAALLSGVTVHWWYISKSVMPFEEYGNASRLWWQAWIQAQGGVLEGFSHDWASISSGFFRTVPPPKALDLVALAGPNPQPEMTKVCVRTNGVAGRAPHPPEAKSQPAPAPHQVVMNPISAPPPQPEPAQVPTPVPAVPASMPVAMPVPVVQKPVPPVPPVQAIEIPKEVDLTISSVGILWKSLKNDLDLSLRVKAGSKMEDPGELYWNTPPHNSMATKTNKLGRYLHDYRRGSEDFEWIELAKNIKAEDLANNLEVWCDNYDGPGPVAFTAVIVDQGKVIASLDLAISGKGDGRRESDSRESSSSWLRLPVETMLKPAAD